MGLIPSTRKQPFARVSDYATLAAALAAAAGRELYLDTDVVLAVGDLVDFSGCSNTVIYGPGRIKGPAVADQGQPSAYLKLWGSKGGAVAYSAAIAEAASTFPVAQTFAEGDMLLLSNYPTDASDAYTEGGADAFGEKARAYANTSTANKRQTRRRELLTVRTAAANTFDTTQGTLNAYQDTTALQFEKITPLQNIKFLGVTFENVHINLRYTRNVSFVGCTGLTAMLVGQLTYNTSIDFAEFDARNTDCRVDFYEASRGVRVTGIYRNINTPGDNAAVKMLGCADVQVDVIVEGCKGAAGNGVMVDTAFTENPSGYTDLPSKNFRLNVVARSCDGQGAVVTCDPYAAKASYGVVSLTSDNTGCQVKGGENIDLYVNSSYADVQGNSVYLYGSTGVNVFGKSKGGIYKTSITNPRDATQTQQATGTSRIGAANQASSQPAFQAYLTHQLVNATGDGTEVQIPFDSNIFDYTNGHAAGVFTAPLDGIYMFTATVKLQGVDGTQNGGWLRLEAAGTEYYLQPAPTPLQTSQGNGGWGFSTAAFMQAGQTAKLFIKLSGGNKDVTIQGSGSLETYWSGVLLN